MNKVIQNATWTVFGLTLALLSGAPALADDTELLLVAPPDPSQTKPNVMFILDTSGSMGAVQISADLYDSAQVYTSGTCDILNLYYSTSGTVPVCDGSNTLYVWWAWGVSGIRNSKRFVWRNRLP